MKNLTYEELLNLFKEEVTAEYTKAKELISSGNTDKLFPPYNKCFGMISRRTDLLNVDGSNLVNISYDIDKLKEELTSLPNTYKVPYVHMQSATFGELTRRNGEQSPYFYVVSVYKLLDLDDLTNVDKNESELKKFIINYTEPKDDTYPLKRISVVDLNRYKEGLITLTELQSLIHHKL